MAQFDRLEQVFVGSDLSPAPIPPANTQYQNLKNWEALMEMQGERNVQMLIEQLFSPHNIRREFRRRSGPIRQDVRASPFAALPENGD